MLDLALNLIDRLIQLLGHRDKINRQFFADFVQPTIDQFEKVHQQYLDHFQKYRTAIIASSELTTSHPVLDQIRSDNRFTAGDRATLRSVKELHGREEYQDFVDGIYLYLTNAIEGAEHMSVQDLDEAHPGYQVARTFVHASLRHIFSRPISTEEKRQAALESIDYVLDVLQERYSMVVLLYYRLKRSCLTPAFGNTLPWDP